MYLKVWAAALALVIVVGACSKDDDKLPAIDGYNNSDEVAATNLVAHWTFDTNNNEVISGTAPSHTFGTVSSTTGQIGNALNMQGGVLVFPAIDKINTANALNNFTVSLWVNVKNTKAGTGAFTAFFGLVPTGVSDIWGDVMALAETGRHLPGSDTLELKNYMNTHPVGAPAAGNDNLALHNNDAAGTGPNAQTGSYFMGAKRWAHYVMRWNATTHKFDVIADGVNSGGYSDRGTTGIEVMSVPVQAVFGSLASSDIGFAGAPAQQDWNPFANAMVDDVRVFNTALSDAEVTALFNLGTAGR